jgi:hypothetical protein
MSYKLGNMALQWMDHVNVVFDDLSDGIALFVEPDTDL